MRIKEDEFSQSNNNRKNPENKKNANNLKNLNLSYGSALNDETQPVNLCFSGCGFLISYHIGVIYCLTEYGGDIYCNSNRIYGSSGGALIGVSILAGFSTKKMLEIALGVVYIIKSKKLGIFDPFLRLSQLIKIYLENNLPENIHELCTDRLFINLTEFPSRKSLLVSKYHCKSDLIDAIVCTTFIPIIFGLIPPVFRGKRYIDGGLSDNLPRHQVQYFRQSSIDEELCLKRDNKYCSDIHGVKSCGERIKNITISPFSGEGDICPREKDSQSSIRIELMNMCFGINFKNIYRVLSAFIFPSAQHIVQSCIDGYLDTKKYLTAYDIARNTENFVNNGNLTDNSPSQATRVFDDEFSEDFELYSPFYISINKVFKAPYTEILDKLNSELHENQPRRYENILSSMIYNIIKLNIFLIKNICNVSFKIISPILNHYINISLNILPYIIPTNRARQVFKSWKGDFQGLKRS